MENLGYLVAAYAVVWVGLAVYVAWLGAQLGRLRRDVTTLRGLIEQVEQPDEAPGAG
jgi:CcmD family protein